MRTDDDSWDITTSVGSTALFVAAARALEARKPEPLAVDRYAEVFCRDVGGHWSDVLDGTDPDSVMMSEFGAHFVDFQAARTRYFDEFFTRATDAGVRQVVILAAGLDSRAYRLGWPVGTVIYELDQPQVLEFKRGVLEKRGEMPTAERVEVPVDLRDDWSQALRDKGFDPARPTAFLVEGLLVYLPATAQQELFAGIDALAAPGSHVGVEDNEPMPDEVFQEVRAAEREAGGDMIYFQLIYNERVARADEWFGQRGWAAEATPLAGLLRRLGRPLPDAGSESESMIKSNTLISAVKQA